MTRWLLTKSPVLFKFRPEVTQEHKQEFVTELKTLKNLPCVKEQRLIVGGPSITDPIERSRGFHFALLSFHEDRAALEEYQKSDEHHRYERIKIIRIVEMMKLMVDEKGNEHVYVSVQGGLDEIRFRG